MNKIIIILFIFCMLTMCTQVVTSQHVVLEMDAEAYTVEVGDTFEIDFWIRNTQNVNVDTWVMNISFSDEISVVNLEMSPLWLTKYHYLGDIAANKIINVQSHNPSSTNMNSLLFTVLFKAEKGGVSTISFDDIIVVYAGYDVGYIAKDISIGIDVEYVPSDVDDKIENTPPIAMIGKINTTNNKILYFDAIGSIDDKAIISYDWTFGDNTTANGINVTHSYAIEGNYTVTLTVRDEEGLYDTYSTLINVSFIREEVNNNIEGNNDWVYWVIIIVAVIFIIGVLSSRYEIEW